MGRGDPVAESRPAGALRLLTPPPQVKSSRAPSEVVIVSERDVTHRQISDGRPLPKDASPSPSGYSTGRWQGDRLMVETNGLRDGTRLDRKGSPLRTRPG